MQEEIKPAALSCRIYPLGDGALSIDWGNRIDEATNRQVLTLWDRLRRARLPGVSDFVPAYSSLTLLFDADELRRRFHTQSPYKKMQEMVEHVLADPLEISTVLGRYINIPVCYDPAMAPDLPALATRSGLTVPDIIQLHTAPEYRVFMLGFLPGFPYMGTVDERIAAPRLAQPRQRVHSGSVGIAGVQTGIYPLESPGGWNLIGRTPLRMFDAQRTEPTLLQPGDQVRFYAVSLAQFYQIQSGA